MVCVCMCVHITMCVCVCVYTSPEHMSEVLPFFFFTFAVTINYLLHTLTFLHTVTFFFCLCGHDILLITYCNLFTYCYPFFFTFAVTIYLLHTVILYTIPYTTLHTISQLPGRRKSPGTYGRRKGGGPTNCLPRHCHPLLEGFVFFVCVGV